MNKNKFTEMNDITLADLAESILMQLASMESGPLDLPTAGILPVIVVSAVPIPAILGNAADEDDFDEDDFDEDEGWDEEDEWEDEEPCSGYEPISEDNDTCLYLCPGCGTCMRQYSEEVCG